MGLDKKGLANKGMAGLKSPLNKSGMPRMDSMSKLDPLGRGMGGYLTGRMGVGGPWSPQDDQLLMAIVAEFSQNWCARSGARQAAATPR